MKISVASAIAATLMGMFSTANADILLQDFSSGDSGWEVKTDDAIYAGESVSSFFAGSDRSYFDGIVRYQPSLNEPGFVKIIGTKSFPNIAGCAAIEVTMDSVAGYNGYFVAFGDTPPHKYMPFPFEYRAAIPIAGPGQNGYTIPLSEFSSDWYHATGRIFDPCFAFPSVCPPPAVLSNIQFMEIWAQGVEGDFTTDLFSIKAVGC